MEFTISKQNLLNGLSVTQGIVEKRNTMPILSNVLFEADGTTLRLVATDLEIGVRVEVDAKVKSKGRVTLPARKLFDIVKELPDKELHFKLHDNNQMELSVGKFHSRIAGLPADEYPNLPAYEDGKFLEVSSKELDEMLARTVYAVSTDETRYNLNGVYFESIDGGKKLRLVATDGHRLAVTDKVIKGISKAWGEKGIIVPRKAVAELHKLLEKNEKIEISFQKNHGIVRAGETVLLMQLIDGEFPKYEQVIPKELNRKAYLSRAALITSIRRVLPVSDDRSHLMRLKFSNGGVTLEANTSGIGEASEEVPAEYEGGDLTIGFNARYLMDALNSLGGDDVEMELIDEVNPAIVRTKGSEDTLAVVMPMRI